MMNRVLGMRAAPESKARVMAVAAAQDGRHTAPTADPPHSAWPDTQAPGQGPGRVDDAGNLDVDEASPSAGLTPDIALERRCHTFGEWLSLYLSRCRKGRPPSPCRDAPGLPTADHAQGVHRRPGASMPPPGGRPAAPQPGPGVQKPGTGFLMAAALVGALALAGCGGGGASDSAPNPGSGPGPGAGAPVPAPAPAPAPSPAPSPSPPGVADKPATTAAASRFLSQASFGARQADIDRVRDIGYRAWLDEQFAKPRTGSTIGSDPVRFYYCDLESQLRAMHGKRRSDGVVVSGETEDKLSAFFTATTVAEDQLRQRMVWAWSQILVATRQNWYNLSPDENYCQFMDLLGDRAFGNYRDMLEAMSTSFHMAEALTFSGNEAENFRFQGQIPDQNFAREIMQLFTIGLVQLNLDGTPKLDAQGRTIPTYNQADIVGLSKVFTGWVCNRNDASQGYASGARFGGLCNYRLSAARDESWVSHSCSEMKFLGVTLNAGVRAPDYPQRCSSRNTADSPRRNLKTALDTLFNHPNVGPFIGKQLIQRFTSSNPSKAYVSRVATVFNDNGQGVRGDMQAVMRAILLDPEARGEASLTDPAWGKVREPFLRTVQLFRVFNADTDGLIYREQDRTNCDVFHGTTWRTGQFAFRPNTVFNFYRPGFVKPSSEAAAAGLVAPETQVLTNTELYYWSYNLTTFFALPTSRNGVEWCNRMNPPRYDTRWLELGAAAGTAEGAAALVDHVTAVFVGGPLPAATRSAVIEAVRATTAPASLNTTIDRRRIHVATTLVLMTPSYLVQK